MKQALILVDIQNDYFPGGKFELANTSNTVKNIRKLLDYFRDNSYPIIHIQHISLSEDATFFIKDSVGVEIYKGVTPIDGEHLVQKNYPNSFFKTNLMEILEKEDIKNVVVCGMMSHMCIDSTVRGGFELGLKCTLVEDCCTTRDLVIGEKKVNWENVHNSFMASLSTFAKVITVDDFIKNA
ncbi:cysteine hydrolase family protein [Clostridium cylindrosporum]|uniref:Nicotinamidase-like amidase n=1 Tax=Clostridium cylindrosporum DSM 605 TaxID=1121307 RepID=A0A0J8G2N5_CLOCY|nr:cysteine hydrolase family protein [Clostridium cylindrosporum]KMT21981.1 nicotinamidase-like amidase [Clostridium cylindrosporum DSM 605]